MSFAHRRRPAAQAVSFLYMSTAPRLLCPFHPNLAALFLHTFDHLKKFFRPPHLLNLPTRPVSPPGTVTGFPIAAMSRDVGDVGDWPATPATLPHYPDPMI